MLWTCVQWYWVEHFELWVRTYRGAFDYWQLNCGCNNMNCDNMSLLFVEHYNIYNQKFTSTFPHIDPRILIWQIGLYTWFDIQFYPNSKLSTVRFLCSTTPCYPKFIPMSRTLFIRFSGSLHPGTSRFHGASYWASAFCIKFSRVLLHNVIQNILALYKFFVTEEIIIHNFSIQIFL